MISDDGPLPTDEQLLEWIKDAIEELIHATKALQDDCGTGSAGLKTKAELQRKSELYRKILYATLHGCQPPCDLPDNWGAAS